MFKRRKKPTLEELKNELRIAENEKSAISTFLENAKRDYQKADEEVERLKIEYENALFDLNQNGGIERYHIESKARKAFVLAIAAFSCSENEYSALIIRFKKARKVYQNLKNKVNKLENK